MFQSARPRGRTRLRNFMSVMLVVVSIRASSREDATQFDIPGFILTLFQSARPRGRTRLCKSFENSGICSFNPRVLAGGRDKFSASESESIGFQSARPRGRTRQGHLIIFTTENSFNPRVLAGGRDKLNGNKYHCHLFQSARPRGRTRLFDADNSLPLDVSIRASSREDATPCNGKHVIAINVSIRASSREDATIPQSCPSNKKSFNPRVLAGGRDILLLTD